MLILVLAGLWRDAHVPVPEKRVLAKSGGLEPFHVIELADLRLTCQSDAPPSPQLAAKIVGRYSSEYLEACATIDPKSLSSGAQLSTELNNRILVRHKVQATNVFAGMHPPFKAGLMGSPRERATTALIVNDLLVLDLRKDGDGLAVVVAVPAADEPTLASFVARSDLLLVSGQP
jgi:hypothetical protein